MYLHYKIENMGEAPDSGLMAIDTTQRRLELCNHRRIVGGIVGYDCKDLFFH